EYRTSFQRESDVTTPPAPTVSTIVLPRSIHSTCPLRSTPMHTMSLLGRALSGATMMRPGGRRKVLTTRSGNIVSVESAQNRLSRAVFSITGLYPTARHFGAQCWYHIDTRCFSDSVFGRSRVEKRSRLNGGDPCIASPTKLVGSALAHKIGRLRAE